jgi:hypothetical protein
MPTDAGLFRDVVQLRNIVPGVFTPALAKHSKSFNLIDTLAVGVDRIKRNFEPMHRQVENWRQTQVTDEREELVFYSAFVDGKLDAPRSLLPEVHRLYFEPQYEEFSPRTMWSLSNASTSAFKKLDPIPQFKAMARSNTTSTATVCACATSPVVSTIVKWYRTGLGNPSPSRILSSMTCYWQTRSS